jgi:hypothetical protein
MTKQNEPVQVTIIPAEPGWSLALFTGKTFWYQPVIAWKITTGGTNGVEALSFDPMANGCHEMQMLRDPQGVFRVPCSAFESEISFATEQEALAYLQSPRRRPGYVDSDDVVEFSMPPSAA